MRMEPVHDLFPAERWPEPLFPDRAAAGRALATLLETDRDGDALVVGLARGGVAVAAEVAGALDLELDALAVRKVRHPLQPEYALGAVTPGGGVYVRPGDGLSEELIRAAIVRAAAEADALDRRLHESFARRTVRGRRCLVVDDGLATGATMIAAVRWARARGAAEVTAAAPVAAADAPIVVAAEADGVRCLHVVQWFGAVGLHYDEFEQLDDDDVIRLLHAAEQRAPVGAL